MRASPWPATASVDEALTRGARAAGDGGARARGGGLDARAVRLSRRGPGAIAVVDYGCKRSILRRLARCGRGRDRLPARRRRRRARGLRRRPALERPRRPGAARGRGRRRCATCSAVSRPRDLPRPPAARARDRPRDVQAPVRPPRRQPSGARAARRAACSSRARTTASPSRRREDREATHVSLYDGTVEGLELPELRARSVQFHPEAGPGPHDAWPIIERWVEEVSGLPRRPDLELDLPDRLRPDRDRAGLRVRLRRLPGAEGAARGRLPHDRRQLEPGDDHDRPRASPTARTSSRSTSKASPACSSASGPTRCCRRWAARRRSTSPSSSPRRASSTSSASS